MKKVISIFIIILLCLSFLSINVQAVDNSINLRFETSQTETDQVSVKVYTGDFEGVSEGSNLNINIQLNYKAEDIIAVTTQSINNWHVDSTLNEIVFSTENATANTEIGTITIMLRTTSSNSSGTFNLQNIEVTGDNGYTENYGNIPVNYSIGSLPGDNQNPGDEQKMRTKTETKTETKMEIKTEIKTKKIKTIIITIATMEIKIIIKIIVVIMILLRIILLHQVNCLIQVGISQ